MATATEIISVLTNQQMGHMAAFNRLSDMMPVASADEIETIIAVFTAGREYQRQIIAERVAQATERLY